MKFCDPRTKYILTENEKYVGDEMCKSFYGLPEKSDYFNHTPTFTKWCETPLEERENYYNITNIKWLNITDAYIKNKPKNQTKKMSQFYTTYMNKKAYQFYSNKTLRMTIHLMKRILIYFPYTISVISKKHHSIKKIN